MLEDEDLKQAIDFHGHLCFGLCVGVSASKLALEILGLDRAKGEEIVVIAENDSCAVDGIQTFAGATLGRGNLIVRDWGKHAYTFISRPDQKALRLVLNREIFTGISSKENRIDKVRSADDRGLFSLEYVDIEVPPLAEVVGAVQCSRCKEFAMKTRTVDYEGRIHCIPCHEKVYIEPSG